jgi:aspartate aminotransferase-like enzyme
MNLRIPGPAPLPQTILDAMHRQTINHRGAESQAMVKTICTAMQALCGTTGEIYLMTASGWGGVESALVNTVSPGDSVLCASSGYFGEEFGAMARLFGADVTELTFPDGEVVDPDAVAAKLRSMKNVKAVLLTHNESYTGVANPLKEIAAAVRANSAALLHVDAVSATGAIETRMDEWGVDTICTASQKALMGPPGMALVAVSERAYRASELCQNKRYYFHWKDYHEHFKDFTTPTTSALTVIFALAAAADMILAEGIDNVYARHERIAAFTRERVRGLGLELFAHAGHSPTLTAVRMPAGVSGDDVRAIARDEHGVEFGASWYRLQGKLIRIGHMGITAAEDIDHAVEVLGDVVAQLRARTQPEKPAKVGAAN